MELEILHEEVEVHGQADRVCAARGGGRYAGYRGLPEDWAVSEATYYRWKQVYGGLGPSELRKMRQLEEENQKLNRLVADLSLDKAMLQEVLAKKV